MRRGGGGETEPEQPLINCNFPRAKGVGDDQVQKFLRMDKERKRQIEEFV